MRDDAKIDTPSAGARSHAIGTVEVVPMTTPAQASFLKGDLTVEGYMDTLKHRPPKRSNIEVTVPSYDVRRSTIIGLSTLAHLVAIVTFIGLTESKLALAAFAVSTVVFAMVNLLFGLRRKRAR
jgi:hypothetical protein